MTLIVQKFGGSSVAGVHRIKNVAKRVHEARKKGHSLVVVVSALGDTTDELLKLASEITQKPSGLQRGFKLRKKRTNLIKK